MQIDNLFNLMDIRNLLEERKIELKYIDKPTYIRDGLLEQQIITNDDSFTINLLENAGFRKYYPISAASLHEAEKLAETIGPGEIVGVGGGKAIDVAKYVSNRLDWPLVLVPTGPSHDGLASVNCSLYNGQERKSLHTKYPRKLIIPLHLWKTSGNLRKAGICDLLSNRVALQDVQLAYVCDGKEFDETYREMSKGAIEKLVDMEDDKGLAEALILSGIAMEKGSQYCSGSDHDAERLLESKIKNTFYHGQLAGTGTLISAYCYLVEADNLPTELEYDSSKLFEMTVEDMKNLGVLDFALEPLVYEKFNPKWLKELSKVRPDRYNLWNKVNSEEVDWNEVTGMLKALKQG